jgi:hypothetical protein
VADIARIKAHTGCDAVMIGRAAFANPWIFQRRDRHEVSPDEVRHLIEIQMQSSIDFYGLKHGITIMRKYVNRYLQPYEPPRDIRTRLLTSEDPVEFMQILDDILALAPLSSCRMRCWRIRSVGSNQSWKYTRAGRSASARMLRDWQLKRGRMPCSLSGAKGPYLSQERMCMTAIISSLRSECMFSLCCSLSLRHRSYRRVETPAQLAEVLRTGREPVSNRLVQIEQGIYSRRMHC